MTESHPCESFFFIPLPCNFINYSMSLIIGGVRPIFLMPLVQSELAKIGPV